MRMKILDYVEEKRNIALEEIAEGKSVVEKEIVIYAKITDLSILSKADSVEEQEQWEIKLPKTEDTASSGRMRVRKIIKEGTTQYVYTTKTEVTGGNLETSLEATEDTFKQFKLLASSGMVKTRYTYAIRGSELVWEVDVPILTGDNKTDWCKIDLEYKVYPTTIPELPPGFNAVITNQRDKQTKEEKELLYELYETIFLRKNAFITPAK